MNNASIHFFLLFIGNIRRFRRICEHIQSQVCSKRFSGPGSPPSRVTSVTNTVSESSSCGSDSSERLSCYKRQVMIYFVRFEFIGCCSDFSEIFIYRLKMTVRAMCLSSIRRLFNGGRLPQQIIITKYWENQVQKRCDRGKRYQITYLKL